MNDKINEYMQIAYNEAIKSYKKNEIPVGAIIVKNQKIISKAHNNRQKKYNLLGHAEINAILKAEKKIKDWRLDGCIMYVTLEPCLMCQHLIKEARIDKVVYLLKQKNEFLDKQKYIQTNDCNEFLQPYEKLVNNFFKKLRD